MVTRQEFFDNAAQKWEDFNPPAEHAPAIDAGLDRFGPLGNKHIVDLGCGTGTLTARVLSRLGAKGRVTAIDFSQKMIEAARARLSDPRVSFLCQDARHASPSGPVDIICCYNTFPHFTAPAETLVNLRSWLSMGGQIAIWHGAGRKQIAQVHEMVGGPVAKDAPLPADELGQFLELAGFELMDVEEAEDRYWVRGSNG